MIARAVKTLVALVCLSAGVTPATAQVNSGTWVGSTSQGQGFGFDVSPAQNVTQVRLGVTGCGTTTMTITLTAPISNNHFTFSGGFCPSVSGSGTFSSAKAASGAFTATWSYIPYACPCSGSTNVNWSAIFPSTLTINDVTLTEGDAGTANANFTVSLTPAASQTVTVNYATANGTATSGTDYLAQSGTLTFPAGTTTRTITVPVNGDTAYETTETFAVNLSGATGGARIGDSQGTGTIVNNDPMPTLSIADSNVIEGDGGTTSAAFLITLSGESGAVTTVQYTTANGTALAGSDYATASGTLTFAPGTTVQTATVLVNGDAEYEPTEDFFVNLSGPVNATLSDVQGHGVIANDDSGLTIDDASVVEGNGGTVNAQFTVTLLPASGHTVTVDYTTMDGSAAAGSDYLPQSGTLTFLAGTTTATIAVSVNGDAAYEVTEVFAVNLSGAAGATILDAQGIGTITNDDPVPIISIGDVSVLEGESGTNTAAFSVLLAGESEETATVAFATADGTALAGSDYVGANGILTFAPGTTVQTVIVLVNGDTEYEPTEDFFVNLSNPTNAVVSDGQGHGTIANDDSGITIGDLVVSEGNAGTVDASFTVTVTPTPSRTVTVDYATADQTASVGTDYESQSGTLTFPVGTTTATIVVSVNGDTVYEVNETFAVNLSSAVGATVLDVQAIGTISNDDPAPAISIGDVSVVEGDSGTTAAAFTVTLTGSTAAVATVQYGTANGTALAGSDFSATSGTLMFAPGTTTQTVTVMVNGDTEYEPTEEFFVNLSNPTNAVVSDGQGQGTIPNDDPLPTMAIADVSVSEGNTGATAAGFTVTLTNASAETITVQYASADGTAVAGSDYVATSGTLTFPPGTSVLTFNIPVHGDNQHESNEDFCVNLSNPTNATLSDPQGCATILNDDPVPAVSIADVSVSEGDGATTQAVFAVTLTNPSVETVTLQYTTADGTATAGSDYLATSGTLTFVPGTTAQTVTVAVNGDPDYELNEDFVVNLSAPTNATLSDGQGRGTILNDDISCYVQFYTAASRASESAKSATVTVTRTVSAAYAVTVDYATSDGTASAGLDYTAAAGTLSFAVGQSSATFAVPITEDALEEGNETVQLSLSNPTGGAAFGTISTAVLSILDNERALQFGASTYSVSEAVPSATIKVKRSGLLTGSVSVDYVTSDGTAKAGVDYQARAGTLSFGPNVKEKSFTIPIVNDTLDETNETVVVRLRNAVGASVAAEPLDTAILTITDNDAGGVVQFSAAKFSVAESKGSALITLTRTGGSAGGVTVMYSAVDGTAIAGSDYAPTSGTLTFNAGKAWQSFTVPIINDTVAEGVETLRLELSGATGGATLGPRSSAVLAILDDESTIELGAPAVVVVEGGTAAVPVKRTGSVAGTVTVHYATLDDTAVAGTDYTAKNGTLTFGPGVTTQTIVVPTVNDTLSEPNKTLTVALDTLTGAVVLGHQMTATVTINDNDPGGVIQFSAASYSVSEAGANATITVSRTGGTASGVTVGYATNNGTANAGEDYTTTAGTISIAANQSAATFKVPIRNDVTPENSETVLLSLGPVSGGATLGPRNTAVLTINDNDGPMFQFSVPTYVVKEATAQVTITVKRVGSLAQAATVDFAASDGTATRGSDYSTTEATLSFGAGIASKTITIPIVQDTLDEPDETANLTLSAPSAGHHLGSPSTAILTIQDDDTAGTVQFLSPVFSKVEGEAGTTGLAAVTVTRSGGVASGVTVDYATADGTATSDLDYVATSGTLSFAANQTRATFSVQINGDAELEGNETVKLTLSNPHGSASLGAQNAAQLWIAEPAGAAKLVFIHHSTGGRWLADANGQLAIALRDNNYFVSATNYGWGPDWVDGTGPVGDHTDIGEWWEWFRGTNRALYLDALFHEFGKNTGEYGNYARLEDPNPDRENEIVVLKSCFPNSNLLGDPDAPPTTGDNPLRGQAAWSTEMTVANAKGIYNDLLEYFATRQDILFVVVTAPPLVAGDTSPEQAANSRALNHWLVNDWLASYGHNNVAVFDFYNVLTSNAGLPTVNDLGKETGNHHRWWNGGVQHAHPTNNNVAAYAASSTDSHPTIAGGKKATGEFVTLLNFYYNRWKGVPMVPGARGAKSARDPKAPVRLGPEAIAPPGTIAPRPTNP